MGVLVLEGLISSVQSLSYVRLFVTPWIAARQASLFITISQSSLRLMSIESVMPSSHLILSRPLLLLPSIPCIKVDNNEFSYSTCRGISMKINSAYMLSFVTWIFVITTELIVFGCVYLAHMEDLFLLQIWTTPHWKKFTIVKIAYWKRLWCWEGLGAGGEGEDRGWDGWMASPTRWT